jgi:uncharacterized protein
MIFQLFITKDCNLNCKYCFEGKKKNEKMNISIIKKIILFMKEYVKNDFVIDKLITVNFNGGEALLQKDFIIEAVKQFKDEGIDHFSISTNFMLIDKTFMLFLIDNNFTVQISIDGVRKTHDLNRIGFDGKGSFDIVIKNIIEFKKLATDKNIILSMVFTPKTVNKLSSNINYLIRLGFHNIVTCFNDREKWTQNDIHKIKIQAKKIRKLYVKNFKNNSPLFLKIISLDIENFLFGKSSCGICKDLIGILPNGNVIACGAFIGNSIKEDKFKIGSIHNLEIDYDYIHKLLKWKCEYDECNNCSFNTRCRNDCMACNFDSTGNINCPSMTTCVTNKIFIKESEKALLKLLKNETFKNYYSEFFKEMK